MSDSLFSDISSRTAKLALDGLSLRQQAISRNLANIDTPGFKAQTVNFQETLTRMVDKGNLLPLTITDESHLTTAASETGFSLMMRPGGSSRADENNVDVDVEMTDISETGVQYQAVEQAISKKLMLLKTLAR
ncbi:MAG: flagellar basal body rod protein FlgB [Chloroflexi bacterium]|jgi:flagellar basal-body rod protein FlgB|nr:flagellar basal body rod protein FlgB [Chloroflexota bacterium]